MKGIVSWFVENHVAANLLMIFFLLAGVITGLSIKVEVIPEFTLDRISISVEYPGASPSEVEEAVVRKIEEAISGLAGIERINSLCREGFGSVIVEVMKGWDIKELLDKIKAEVDRITTLPEEAERPIVREITRRVQVISLAIYGDAPEETIKHISEKIKDDITNIPGITLAELSGIRNEEIHIEIPEDTLRQYRLSLGKVAQIVKAFSLDLPAGSIKTEAGEILIRTKGRRYYAKDYEDIPIITQPDGTVVTLGQIAEISDGFEDVDIISRFQRRPAAILQVYRVADQNALEVADKVKRYVKEISPTLPEGIQISTYRDMSVILRSRLNLLLKNMAIGLILVSFLLGLFLDLRLAFWVTMGIPVSFMCGLMALPHFNVSINMISLFAFIMVLGIVVDDAIVIGENIFRKQEQGLEPFDASVKGTIEVGRPVIFAVLTTMVAFYPILFGGGMIGKIARNIPIVIILVLFGSLIESILILPSHLRLSGKRVKDSPRMMHRLLRWFVERCYIPIVRFSISWRYAVSALGILLLCLSLGIWKGGWIKFTFFPKVESDVLICTLTMPTGTPIEKTEKLISHIEDQAIKAIKRYEKKKDSSPILKYVASLVGMHIGGRGPNSGALEFGSHLGQIFVQLEESEKRDIGAVTLCNAWRKELGHLPEAESITFQYALFTPGNPIEVHLSLDDYNTLKEAAEELKDELRKIPGLFDIRDSFLPGKEELRIKLKPISHSLGITLRDLALQVRHAFYGAEAIRFQRGKDEVKVMVRYPEDERHSLYYVENMRIRDIKGREIPFSELGDVKFSEGYTTIERVDGRRVIKVMADVDEDISNANEIRKELSSSFLPQLKERYPGLRYSMEGEGKEQKESLSSVIKGFVVALFVIYALLAIPFKSFTQPFIVMWAIPFSMVGALLGHIIMGFNLSILSVLGMVGLAGVAVNDSLVLIDATNRLRAEGLSVKEAIVKAGAIRFRAIILTSLTTFAGLTPMIMEKSIQAQFLIPMAISLGFGVLFATGITLIIIPCGYLILEDIHELIKRG